MSRSQWGRGPVEKTSFESDFLVEWYVENNLERYKKLSLCGAPVREETAFDSRTGKKSIKKIPTHAVVCCVLEVPFTELETVTQQLRNSTNLRTSAPYLIKAAEAADDASVMLDRMAKLEKCVRALQDLVLDQADDLDKMQAGEERVGRRYPKQSHTDNAKRRLNEIEYHAEHELKRMRNALDEKRADVAAKLLAAMPDDV